MDITGKSSICVGTCLAEQVLVQSIRGASRLDRENDNCTKGTTAVVCNSWSLQWPILEGKQSTHGLPDLTQEQALQCPLPLQRQHTGLLASPVITCFNVPFFSQWPTLYRVYLAFLSNVQCAYFALCALWAYCAYCT